MMNAALNSAKNAPKTAFEGERRIDTLEMALIAAHARFGARDGYGKMLDKLESELWRQAQALVDVFNDTVGEDVLYLMECAGTWVLYGRPDEEAVDKRLLWGFRNADELTRLVLRLENGMWGVEACGASGTPAPYKKERLMV